jgi:hypothetical protein
MTCMSCFSVTVLLGAVVATCGTTTAADQTPSLGGSYAVVVKNSTAEDSDWKKVVAALTKKHNASIVTYDASVEESLDTLKREFPRYACFVSKHEDVSREFVAQIHQLTRKLDNDPYTDTFWGILTGYNAKNALAIASHNKPLVVKKVVSGTEFATEMVTEGQWYDELVKNRHVKKVRDGKAEELKGPDDTTKALVDLLNEYNADLVITSGHATQAAWQIGFRYRNGQFRSEAGQMYGLDTAQTRIEIDSPNPKVYLPIGNCLMGDINGSDAMALAWMNDVGVKQMIGYTVPTWFGYMGWGVLDYFVEQPGRYTLAEAFFANNHALIDRLSDASISQAMKRGLTSDRDIVAIYGDPKWSATLAEMPKYYGQTLQFKDGLYTLTITPNRGEHSFKPVNTNGSQRGWRPIIQFLPHRITDIEIVAGADFHPVVTDDFILVPNPRDCDPDRKYVVCFKAKQVVTEETATTSPALELPQR